MKQAIKQKKNPLPWERSASLPAGRVRKTDLKRKGRVKNARRQGCTALLAILTCVLSFSTAYAQLGGLTRYVYDDNGRLHAVISPTGEAAIYEYDPAGNITAIRRNMAATLEVLDFSPREGVPGNQVTIVGTGFGGGVNAVAFNGAAAQIVSVNAPVITVTVPAAATTGPISVTTPGGTATTVMPFTVKGISVAPSTATVFSDQTVQFSANVVLPGNPGIVWSVDGIGDGSAVVGTISPAGLYTAPKLPVNQPNAVFHVEATSISDASVYGEATVTVRNPEFLQPVYTQIVSVRNGSIPPMNATPSFSTALSVRNGSLPPMNATPAFSAALSVRNGSLPPMNATPSFSAPVSVTNAPSISAIAPLQLQRGASTNITITGANLSGATAFSFINIAAAAFDANITASNISVNGGGSSLTATLTVSTGATTGRRVVVVTAGGRMSPSTDIVANTIEIIP